MLRPKCGIQKLRDALRMMAPIAWVDWLTQPGGVSLLERFAMEKRPSTQQRALCLGPRADARRPLPLRAAPAAAAAAAAAQLGGLARAVCQGGAARVAGWHRQRRNVGELSDRLSLVIGKPAAAPMATQMARPWSSRWVLML